jgi:hypothetical protein
MPQERVRPHQNTAHAQQHPELNVATGQQRLQRWQQQKERVCTDDKAKLCVQLVHLPERMIAKGNRSAMVAGHSDAVAVK